MSAKPKSAAKCPAWGERDVWCQNCLWLKESAYLGHLYSRLGESNLDGCRSRKAKFFTSGRRLNKIQRRQKNCERCISDTGQKYELSGALKFISMFESSAFLCPAQIQTGSVRVFLIAANEHWPTGKGKRSILLDSNLGCVLSVPLHEAALR